MIEKNYWNNKEQAKIFITVEGTELEQEHVTQFGYFRIY